MTTTEPAELKLHCANHNAYYQDCYWCNLRNATSASTPPAPVAEDAVEALARALNPNIPDHDNLLNCEKTLPAEALQRLAAQGYTLTRQPARAGALCASGSEATPQASLDATSGAMTDAELEREVREVAQPLDYPAHNFQRGYWVHEIDVINLIKKYRG